MAKAATTRLAKPPAATKVPEAPAPEVVTTATPTSTAEVLGSYGGFALTLDDAGDIPDSAFSSARNAATQLPFADAFTRAQGSATWKEVFVPSSLDHPARIDDADSIRVDDCLETVGNDDGCAA